MTEQEYLAGWKNYLIRIYFYLTNGVSFVNDFRNLGLGIFALYITLKFTNPWWLLGMAVISVAILTPAGYFKVHKISKVQEWLTTKFGSHYAIKNFDYVQMQYETLLRIEKLLDQKEVLAQIAKDPEGFEKMMSQGTSGQMVESISGVKDLKG